MLERVIKLRAQSLLMDTKRGENLRRRQGESSSRPKCIFHPNCFLFGEEDKKEAGRKHNLISFSSGRIHFSR